MIIEVTGTNTWNKGAELMLRAIQDRLQKHIPEAKIAVDPSFGGYADKARYGLLQKVSDNSWNRTRLGMVVLSENFRKVYGLVTDEDLSLVLDASGFAFGDQHPPERSEGFADQVERWKRRGIPVVLLPQALGPFDKARHRAAFERILATSTHVFARDDESLQHIRKLEAYDTDRVSLAPDFTNLLTVPSYVNALGDDVVCVVPNQRMMEKAKCSDEADAYIPFLLRTMEVAVSRGMKPLILVHSESDERLVNELLGQYSGTARILREEDPLQIKSVLGSVSVVVASRFHALVSSLSQGIPSIGTSWSHKYRELFSDYGCDDLLLSVFSSTEDLEDAFEIVHGAERGQLIERLAAQGMHLKSESVRMWQKVDELSHLIS